MLVVFARIFLLIRTLLTRLRSSAAETRLGRAPQQKRCFQIAICCNIWRAVIHFCIAFSLTSTFSSSWQDRANCYSIRQGVGV